MFLNTQNIRSEDVCLKKKSLNWEDLTEEEKRKLDEFDKSSKMAEFMEKLKEEYGL